MERPRVDTRAVLGIRADSGHGIANQHIDLHVDGSTMAPWYHVMGGKVLRQKCIIS